MPPEFIQTVASLKASHQRGSDYGLSKSLVIKEELARYWHIANDLHGRYTKRHLRHDLSGVQVSVNEWLVPLLSSLLGYEDLTATNNVEHEDRVFQLTHRACNNAVPLLLVTHEFDLDRADAYFGQEGRRVAPHSMMQEYLNAEDAALWGIVSNGQKLRVLRDNVSLTRPAYIEIDFELLFAEELYSDFVALWLCIHGSRLRPTDNIPSQCIIESWRKKAHETGERIRENLRDGVTNALRQLGNGFLQHSKNDKLREALASGELSSEGYFQQLLRLVYRLLFLFTVEERDLLHVSEATSERRAIFAEGYALSRLRERALRRRHYDRNQDLWQGLLVTFGALAKGAPDLGLPALGGLFRADQCPDLDHVAIANEQLLEAIRTLAFFRSDQSLARINYRDMDTEELGSVYESLLELRPVIDVDTSPWAFTFAGESSGERVKGSQRKLTGSYYTPPSLVGELINSTLDPVIYQAVASRPDDPRAAILALNVIDPACGSGHFLLAAARRLAVEIARVESDDDVMDETIRQHALREVVQHCIYGVDRNPLAVELCRTALWIETIEPGKPLSFLDAHLLQGDSLVGILDSEIMVNGIPRDAYKPLTGDDKAVCYGLRRRNGQPHQGDLFDDYAILKVAVAGLDLDTLPEDTLEDVENKRSRWEAGLRDQARARESLRANLFVGSYFAPKTSKNVNVVPLTQDMQGLDDDVQQRRDVVDLVETLAVKHSFLNWHLAFAEIMQDGGFDVVLGNPPWERIKLQEKEFFASRSEEIASAPNKAARNMLIKKLDRENALPAEKALFQEFERAKREAEAAGHYMRTSGRFPLTGVGDLNTYAVFAETFLQLLNPRGRAGMIVPTGISTDHSTKRFFNHIVSQKRLVSLFDFENREAIFAGVHRSYKFCLLTLGGKNNSVPAAEFAFFLHQAEHLKEPERRFELSEEDFILFNPNTRTCPIFRTRRDLEIARKMYRRAGVFWRETDDSHPEDNPWGVKFQSMFHMSNDSDLFRTRSQLEEDGWMLESNIFVKENNRYLPLYEAKLFHQYDHRFATFDGVSDRDIRKGNARLVTPEEKSDPKTFVVPRYWVAEKEVAERLGRLRNDQTLPISSSPAPPPFFSRSRHWLATRSPKHYKRDQPKNGGLRYDSDCRLGSLRSKNQSWIVVFRAISSSTNQRTAILTVIRNTAMSGKAPLLDIDCEGWLHALRRIARSTDERTLLADNLPGSGVGGSASIVSYSHTLSVASALVLANMNSLPLDWATRCSVGSTDMSFFILKQLPVLPPDEYVKESIAGLRYVELIVPRVLKLTYTSEDMAGFANDLGFEGAPFPWDKELRHRSQCELDAIFAQMYGLNRDELEWILDAQPPSASFPSLKEHEIKKFGEYRTQRYILQAFDQLERGEIPNLSDAQVQEISPPTISNAKI